MGEPLEYPLRVRYVECDAQGIVFNSHYLAYFDLSITELWRAAFGSYRSVLERGWDVLVAEANVRYLSPARFEDELQMAVSVVRLGNTSMETVHHVRRGDQLLAEGKIWHVWVDVPAYTKIPIPVPIREGLAPWTV
jgi:acyl-CoA thioester hydrolase